MSPCFAVLKFVKCSHYKSSSRLSWDEVEGRLFALDNKLSPWEHCHSTPSFDSGQSTNVADTTELNYSMWRLSLLQGPLSFDQLWRKARSVMTVCVTIDEKFTGLSWQWRLPCATMDTTLNSVEWRKQGETPDKQHGRTATGALLGAVQMNH